MREALERRIQWRSPEKHKPFDAGGLRRIKALADVCDGFRFHPRAGPCGGKTAYTGERVTEGLLTKQSVEINASRRGVITDAQQAIGMEVRRSVNAGSLITPDMLSAPNAVERGDHVIITAKTGRFSVRSRGKALASAGVGEQVLVENLRSSRTIKASVVAPGHVEIPM